VTQRFVLPPDVVLAKVSDAARLRRLVPSAAPGDWSLSRPRSRRPSRIISADGVELLRCFAAPSTVAEAVVAFARRHGHDPQAVLGRAYPMLRELVAAELLVAEGSALAEAIEASLRSGAAVGGFRVGRLVQVLADVEVYQAWSSDGGAVALKVARRGVSGANAQLAHESAVLAALDGRVTPQLIAAGLHRRRRWLAMTWRSGVSAAHAAAELRAAGAWSRLHRLACRVVRAYAHLHRQGVLHGDVHPRNVLIDRDHDVQIIDFGFSRRPAVTAARDGLRGGVSLFFEPEYARAAARGRPAPRLSAAGEQYSLAALLFGLYTGRDYLRLPSERIAALRAIATRQPQTFTGCEAPAMPAIERVLARGLSKKPAGRFDSMGAFARALEAAAANGRPRMAARASRAGAVIRGLYARLAAIPGAAAPPAPPTASVYYGAAGVAYGLLRMAQARDDAHLLALAQGWSLAADALSRRRGAFFAPEYRLTRRRVHPASLFHSRAGVHVTSVLVAQVSGRAAEARQACHAVLEQLTPSDGPGPRDLTLGPVGSLVAAAMVRESLRVAPASADPGGRLAAALDRTGDVAAADLATRSGLGASGSNWTPSGMSGIAHGWSGLFYALLLWHEVRGRAPLPGLLDALHRLAQRGEPAGRGLVWPIRFTAAGGGATMSSWCNGAPGLTHLWVLAARVYRDPALLAIAERCAWNAWEADAGNGSLCCGEAGRAYAAAAVWRATGEPAWLARARALAERAVSRPSGDDGRADSLFKGTVGAVLAMIELERADGSAFPFFELPR
jgi:serine/threonine-protein kinase